MSRSHCFKPIPDEEGTETSMVAMGQVEVWHPGFKPIPDEEGTETMFLERVANARLKRASNRSPMRRGLKRSG